MSKVFNPTVTYHSPTDGGSVNLTIDDQTLHDLANNGEVDLRFDYNESDDVDTEGRVEFVDKKKATLELESVVNFEKYFKKPRIIKPEYNSLAFEGILKASPFEPIQAGWTHFKTIWTISLASNFIDTDLEQKNVSLTITTGDLTSARLANFPKGDRLFVRCEYYGRSSSGEESSLFSSVRILTVGENPNQIAYNSIVSLLLEKDLSSGLISFPRLAKTIGWIANEEDYNPNVMDGRFLELMKFDHSVKTYFTPSPFYPISVGKTTSIKIPLKMFQTPTTSIVRYQNVYTKVNQEDKNPDVTGILFTQEDGNKNYFTSDSEKILIPNVANEFSFQLNILKFDSPALQKIDNSLFQNYFFFVTKKSTPGADDSLFSQVVRNGVIEFGGNLREPVDFNINLNSKIAIDVHSFGLKQHVSLLEPAVNIYVGDTEEKFQHDGLINHNEMTLTIESLDPEATDIQVEYYSIGRYTNDSINLTNTGVYTMSVSNVGDMTQDRKKKFKFNIGFNTNYVQEETGALELGVVEMGYMVISVVKPDKTNKFYITTKHGEEFTWSQDEDNMYHVVMIQDTSDNSKTYRIEPISNKNLKTEWSLGYYGCPTIANKKYKVIGMIFEVPNSVQSIFENVGDVSKHRFKNKFTVVYETPGVRRSPDEQEYGEWVEDPTIIKKSIISFGRKTTDSSFPNDFNFTPKQNHVGYYFPYLENPNELSTLGNSIPFITFTRGIEYREDLKYNETINGSTVMGNISHASFQSKLEPSPSGIGGNTIDKGVCSIHKRHITYSYNTHVMITNIMHSNYSLEDFNGQYGLGSGISHLVEPYRRRFDTQTGEYDSNEESTLNLNKLGTKTTAEFTSDLIDQQYFGFGYEIMNYCKICKKNHFLPYFTKFKLNFDGEMGISKLINKYPNGKIEETSLVYNDGGYLIGGFHNINDIDYENLDNIENGFKNISNILPSLLKIPSTTDKTGTDGEILISNGIHGGPHGSKGMKVCVSKIRLGDNEFNPGDSLQIDWKRKTKSVLPPTKFTKSPVGTWEELIKKNMKNQFNLDDIGSFYMSGDDFIRFLRGDDGGLYWTHSSGFVRFSHPDNNGPLGKRIYQSDNRAKLTDSYRDKFSEYLTLVMFIRHSGNYQNLNGTFRVESTGQTWVRNIKGNINTTDDITLGYIDVNIENRTEKTDLLSFILYNAKKQVNISQSDIDKIQFRYPSFKLITNKGDGHFEEIPGESIDLVLGDYITLGYGSRYSFGIPSWQQSYYLNFGMLGGSKTTTIQKDPFVINQTLQNTTTKDFVRPDPTQYLSDFLKRHKQYAQAYNSTLRDFCQFTTGVTHFTSYLSNTPWSNYDSELKEKSNILCNQILQHPNHIQFNKTDFTWPRSDREDNLANKDINIFVGYRQGKYYLENEFFYYDLRQNVMENQGCLFYSFLLKKESGINKVYGGRIALFIHDGSINDYFGRPSKFKGDPRLGPVGNLKEICPGMIGLDPGQVGALHFGKLKEDYSNYDTSHLYSGDEVSWMLGCVKL